MTRFTYQAVDFRIPVREGFYRYRQKVSTAYLVTDIEVCLVPLVVHRKPGKPDNRWFVSDFMSGDAIDIAESNSRDEAVEHAVLKLKRQVHEKGLRKADNRG